jgi:hypothetical protein
VYALLTDGQKMNPLSDPIETSIGFGENTSAATLNKSIRIDKNFLSSQFFIYVKGYYSQKL